MPEQDADPSVGQAGKEVPLDDKIAFLSRPAAYPDPTSQVEPRETHASWVFLTDRHAYKLKKPVHTRFVDFRTVASRKHNSEAEVALNRRLAPDVYLDVVPLRLDTTDALRLGGAGTPVDWLVRMVRLPDDATLEHRIRAREVGEPEAVAVTKTLCGFYRTAEPARIVPELYLGRFEDELAEASRQLGDPDLAVADRVPWATLGALLGYLRLQGDELRRRAEHGRIVEGHGDLRPEHIYLLEHPVVLDCLEFDRALRLVDPVDELAFLALECTRLGAPEVGRRILDLYRTFSGDPAGRDLESFYAGCRALLRAKLAVWHLRDPGRVDRDKWVGKARGYLELAAAAAARLTARSEPA